MSTLDLLARSSPDGVTAWDDQSIPAKVRREMYKLAKAEMTESLRSRQADRPRVHDMNTLGLPKDPAPLSEKSVKPKDKFVHGTPVERRLVAGRLLRTSELDEFTLSSSISAPELSRSVKREVKCLKDRAEVEQDALDLVLRSSTSLREDPKPYTRTPPPVRELSPAEKERVALRQQENLLQVKLLHATQKLSRKYQKQLDPRKGPATSCKIHALAHKWEEQHRQQSAGTDHERYNLYVAGQFSTQMELDYYPRKIEPREPATDKHRRHTMHTKYGNALAKNKSSLRGLF
ncbi:hypothetical protein PHYPSEUDO_006642 [Phytophthora pseudosyringae]|uniref:Uncharacterized protein n=1 Tax=Phytophthora pseudosyringae TaxID=221518 RepID=A0A8T1WF61_9STRA|nr:hypothetical protein PHYPSEUDO_006642 [Phytophthora pseudosyringae]